MAGPIELESRIWSDRGTKPAPGDGTYQSGFQPIAAYDNWQEWAVTTDLHNLRDQVGSLDDVYYPRDETYSTGEADERFYPRPEADDHFLDVTGDTSVFGARYNLPNAELHDVAQIRNRGKTGLRLQQNGREVIFLSDAGIPGPDSGLFVYDSTLPLETQRVLVGNPAIPDLTLRGDRLDLNGVNIVDDGTVRVGSLPIGFYDNGEKFAELSNAGNLKIAGTVAENVTF